MSVKLGNLGVAPYPNGRRTKTETIGAGSEKEQIKIGLSKKQAITKGRALVARLTGGGWYLDVWQNMGWHYEAQRGKLRVLPSSYRKRVTYWTMLGDTTAFSRPTNPHFANPNDAVRAQLAYARKRIAALGRIVDTAAGRKRSR